jgi:epoxyqueuosine reductase QueG
VKQFFVKANKDTSETQNYVGLIRADTPEQAKQKLLDADGEGFAKKKEADARRREKAQAEYVEDFLGAVVAFLAFHQNHADLGDRLARAVTLHTTPVHSGTVARTKRIPVE